MADGALRLFTDASIQGQWVTWRDGKPIAPRRRRVGPALAAWIGWHGQDPASRPTVAGQAFLGSQGTQQAEYLAAIHGLHAVVAYARLHTRPTQVLLHLDNQTVANTLQGLWVARALHRYDESARKLVADLTALGIEFSVEEVSEKHAQHRAAHRMSKNAWNQVFFETAWRPPAKPPASPVRDPNTSTMPGIGVEFFPE